MKLQHQSRKHLKAVKRNHKKLSSTKSIVRGKVSWQGSMAQNATGGAVKALQLELKKIQEEPVEGFRVNLTNDDNLFVWEVAIFGPPSTLYEGGYFKVSIY